MTSWRLVPHTGPHPTLADHARHLDLLRQLPEQIAAGEAAKAAGVTFRPGSWCDVFALPDGRLGQVAVNGATVTCYVEDAIAWVTEAPDGLLFCRAILPSDASDPLSIHQGQSGAAWFVSRGVAKSDGLTYGVQPVALDQTYAYIVRSGLTYDAITIVSGGSIPLLSPVPGSSQGISDIADDDIWWADLHRSVVIHGVTLFYPNQRGGLLVGQCPDGGVGGSLNGSDVRRLVPAPLACFEPHVAYSAAQHQFVPFTADRYAICARTPSGAAWLTFTADEFWQFQLVSGPVEPPEQPPTDPPVPPLQPPTEPPIAPTGLQESIMQFAQLDGSKAVPYIELRKSAQAGCVNLILPDGRVFSAHGDDRDPGSDGPWEQGQLAGSTGITYRADGKLYTWVIVPVEKLP